MYKKMEIIQNNYCNIIRIWKGKNMKKKYIVLTIFFILIIILNINLLYLNKTYAVKSSNSTSNLQLMARAINGEARGEPYAGQVAVRSCNIK